MSPCNRVRGEVSLRVGEHDVRLCVTFGALARLENHFQVSGFEGLSARLQTVTPADLGPIVAALSLEDDPVDLNGVPVREALTAVLAAFEALHDG